MSNYYAYINNLLQLQKDALNAKNTNNQIKGKSNININYITNFGTKKACNNTKYTNEKRNDNEVNDALNESNGNDNFTDNQINNENGINNTTNRDRNNTDEDENNFNNYVSNDDHNNHNNNDQNFGNHNNHNNNSSDSNNDNNNNDGKDNSSNQKDDQKENYDYNVSNKSNGVNNDRIFNINDDIKDNKQSNNRKSSIALFIPPFMMSRMNPQSTVSSNEHDFSRIDELDKSLFEDNYSNYGNNLQIIDDINPTSKKPQLTKIITDDIKVQKEEFKDDRKENNTLFPIYDLPLDLDECQTNEEVIESQSLISNKNDSDNFNQKVNYGIIDGDAFTVNEGPFTLDCIRVSEVMNDALDNLTIQRNKDIEPFYLEIIDKSNKYKERMNDLHKKYNYNTKTKFVSIKNNHKSNLKMFKEKESIIHYKLNGIDSSISKMTEKIEKVQSFLRYEIHKNRVFLEKKINELRESLKYAY